MIKHCAALTIAGSDSGGGAGIQADLKTFSAFGVFGTSVITAVTAQNLGGVTAIQPIEPDVIEKQLVAVRWGFPVKAAKTGMLFSAEIITAVAETLAILPRLPLIIDPVMVATSGGKLLQDDAIHALKEKLFPLATLLTPNIPEAEILTGNKIENKNHLESTAQKLFDMFGAPVLLKGGHRSDKAIDILFDGHEMEHLEAPLIEGVNTHGSGCTLSAAITAAVSRGEPLKEAVNTAKTYITQTLKNALQLSPDLHVMNHFPR